MSVIDFIAVHRNKDEQTSKAATLTHAEGTSTGPLSASQFTSHVGHVIEDEMRRALKRHVDVIDPHEMIALAKMVAEMKARYIAMTLTVTSNKGPLTDASSEELRSLRLKIQEMEAAYNEINETIMSHLVDVKGVIRDNV
ncbi:MAG: hypothetical protein ACJZ9F_03045 [Rhodospirillaceae bacterium]|tara:strand:- start:101 stop:520 length:420 start_codon:yes stop_codon:yes gene_type:complete